MKKAIVKVRCVSKKETLNGSKDSPSAVQIDFYVPYENNSIWYQMSGGTTLTLNTINKEAADMFSLGEDYSLEIYPAEGKTES